MQELNTNFLCETKLHREDAQLHQLFKDDVAIFPMLLNKYQSTFPYYTDHTELHSIEVIEFMNKLIGKNIELLNTDELFVLLMAAYLHDSGMGVSLADFKAFIPEIDPSINLDAIDASDIPNIIRRYHHELSGAYIKKYARFFEIPSPEHLFAIVQVSRGHRKTDLFDEAEYPENYALPNGKTICLPYLAALMRLTDEMDVTSDRNISFLYDTDALTNPLDIAEFSKHLAIKRLTVTESSFVLDVDCSDKKTFEGVIELSHKLQDTLDYCKKVIEERTHFTISQSRIVINELSSK